MTIGVGVGVGTDALAVASDDALGDEDGALAADAFGGTLVPEPHANANMGTSRRFIESVMRDA